MVPSQRASAHKGDWGAIQTAHEPPANARRPSRSASPSHRPTRLRTRDEPPARSTRSWTSAPPISGTAPTAGERMPVDCPFRGCQALTTHQHVPQLQYFHPRPGRAVRYHGYRSRNRDASSRSSLVVTLRVPRPDHGFPLGGREVAGDEEVAEAELNKEEWEVVMGDDETAHTQEQFAQKRTAQGESSLGETDEPQEPAAMLNGPAADEMTHNQSTSIPPQAPMTPPPNPPVPSDEPPFAHDSNQPPEQHHEQ